jgi:PIN domain nuclease of toxin-antitoxin system
LREPWDRLILATAIALRLALVTKDAVIHRTGLIHTLW